MTFSEPRPRRYPDLPIPIGNGAGARAGNIIYFGLGSAGQRWLALDLAAPQTWAELRPFPGRPREQARAVTIAGHIYVFGGIGQVDGRTVSFNEVHCYDPAEDRWDKLPTRSPLGLLGGAVWTPDGRQAICVGGANTAIIEGYFADMAAAEGDEAAKAMLTEAYFDRRPQDYLFTADILSYHPDTNRWTNLGRLPFPPTLGAAAAVDGRGGLALVNGEIKPGLRSVLGATGSLSGTEVTWSPLPALIDHLPGMDQEGLAGAFAAYAGDVLLVAGGTNFPGSRAAFRAGRNWAQRGLTKVWHDTVFALVDGQWRVAGNLPHPLSSGLAIAHDDGVLLVGGEGQGGGASASVLLLTYDGGSITVC